MQSLWESARLVHAFEFVEVAAALVTSMHLTTDHIALGLNNRVIYVYDTEGSNRRRLHGHSEVVWALTSCDSFVINGCSSGEIKVWDVFHRLVSVPKEA